MSATLDKIKEEVKTLTPGELKQVRETVDSLLAGIPKPQMTEDEFELYLAAKGIIAPVNTADMDEGDDDWEPVVVSGQPVSEMIVEERR